MFTIETWDRLATAIAPPLPPAARDVLIAHRDRLADYREDYDLSELACFVIVEPGDQPTDLQKVLGHHYDAEPEFTVLHDGLTELVILASDDGYGWVILIPDRPDTDPDLLAYCRRHTD